MATIQHVLLAEGLGASWYSDLEAIKRGATQDGFAYDGMPVTPGFSTIRQPAAAVCVMLVLSDSQVAYGDCVGVAYSGRMGRDRLLNPTEIIAVLREHVVPLLTGREVKAFRPIMESIESYRVDGQRLHSNLRYGVSQALLDTVAKAQHVTMSEVLAEEYQLELIDADVPVNLQTGYDWYSGVDKIILRRGPFIHTGSTHNREMFAKQIEYLRWIRGRLEKYGDQSYRPTVHFDLYGHIGIAFDHDTRRMADYIGQLEGIISPYGLIIEDPVNMGEKTRQMSMMAELKSELRRRGNRVRLMTDELCPTFEDHKAFAAAGAADLQKVKAPDMGGVSNSIECALYLKSKGVGVYLGGSATETERAAQVRTHVALAVRPDQMLASPGMGVDEAHSVVVNEMHRTRAMWKLRR